jgi:protein-tyrosine phosphatase
MENLELYSEILPNLFISGTADDDVVHHGKSLQQLAQPSFFDSIVCLYSHANAAGYYVREQRYGIADAELNEDSKPEIRQLATWLYSEWKSGKRVAAKCQAGWNRSGLVAALVLLHDGFTAEEAISLIRERRSPNALCNQHFVNYIKEVYESEYKVNTLTA